METAQLIPEGTRVRLSERGHFSEALGTVKWAAANFEEAFVKDDSADLQFAIAFIGKSGIKRLHEEAGFDLNKPVYGVLTDEQAAGDGTVSWIPDGELSVIYDS